MSIIAHSQEDVYKRQDVGELVNCLRQQKEKKMKLVPILDANNCIVEIINLEKYKPFFREAP